MSNFLTAKKSTYSKVDDASLSREERIARLKSELREHVRFLSDYEPMSTDWLRMAESMHQIANVAFMETALPLSDETVHVGKQAGKKASGTLWDQEKDELAVRILLEEGKLNLVLRILHRYCEATRAPEWSKTVDATATKYKSEVSVVNDRCRVFEQSVGILLKYVMQHIEALQIIDQPEFVAHASQCFEYSIQHSLSIDGTDFDKMQECLVIHCLSSMACKFEDLDEERVMDLMEEYRTFPLLITYLNAHYQKHSVDTLIQATLALNAIIASDPYQADKQRFLPEASQKPLIALKGLFISELVAKYGIKTTAIQAFWDELSKLEKKHGAAEVKPLTVRGSQQGKLHEEHKES